MDQPGEGKQLLPQRQYNCFSTQPSPQPVVVGPYMSTDYLIDVLLLDV